MTKFGELNFHFTVFPCARTCMHADYIIVVVVISQYYTNDIVVVSVVSTSMTV